MKARILSLELDLTHDRKLTANVEADRFTVGGTAWYTRLSREAISTDQGGMTRSHKYGTMNG
jgi:hypothetical protein